MRTRSLRSESADTRDNLTAEASRTQLSCRRQGTAAAVPLLACLPADPVSGLPSANGQSAAAARRPARKAARLSRHSEAAGLVPTELLSDRMDLDAAVAAAAAADAAAMPPPANRKRRRVQQPQAQQQPQRPGSLPGWSASLDDAMPDALAAAAAAPAAGRANSAEPAAQLTFATSLGTLAPPPIPLFVTPADGVVTRCRKSALMAPAVTLLPGLACSGNAPHAAGDAPDTGPVLQFVPHLGVQLSAANGSAGGAVIAGGGGPPAAPASSSRSPISSPLDAARATFIMESHPAAADCQDDAGAEAEMLPAGTCAAAASQQAGVGRAPQAGLQPQRHPGEELPQSQTPQRQLRPAIKKDASPPGDSRPKRRVSFARGPLAGTADGHPPHEGVQCAARAPDAPPPQPLTDSLTPAHVKSLEVELGEDNAWSVNRLKRRGGLLPPLKRERIYATPQPAKPATVQQLLMRRAFLGQAQAAIARRSSGGGEGSGITQNGIFAAQLHQAAAAGRSERSCRSVGGGSIEAANGKRAASPSRAGSSRSGKRAASATLVEAEVKPAAGSQPQDDPNRKPATILVVPAREQQADTAAAVPAGCATPAEDLPAAAAASMGAGDGGAMPVTPPAAPARQPRSSRAGVSRRSHSQQPQHYGTAPGQQFVTPRRAEQVAQTAVAAGAGA